VLFSHPADFTPVCTTEFIAFARAADRFAARNAELLGLSIDSLFSHLAWVRNIEEKFGVVIPFPIIEDLKMEVAGAYGMVHPGAADTQAVRATFLIDPKGVLRAMVYYPMSNGRSVDEILRLLVALQTSDEHGVATPEGWVPGGKVIVPPPKTADAAAKRATEGYETTDWYFSTRSL
jgi:peroxiredoxin (alkyl hydroperoxide reductase subunit C)